MKTTLIFFLMSGYAFKRPISQPWKGEIKRCVNQLIKTMRTYTGATRFGSPSVNLKMRYSMDYIIFDPISLLHICVGSNLMQQVNKINV